MADASPAPAPPLEVPVKSWPGLTEQGAQNIALAGAAIIGDRFLQHNETAQAVLPAAAIVLVWAYGALRHIRTIGLLRALNRLLPNHLARAKT